LKPKTEIKEWLELPWFVARGLAHFVREFFLDVAAYVVWVHKKPVMMVCTGVLLACVAFGIHFAYNIPSQISDRKKVAVQIGQVVSDDAQVADVSKAVKEWKYAMDQLHVVLSHGLRNKSDVLEFDLAIKSAHDSLRGLMVKFNGLVACNNDFASSY